MKMMLQSVNFEQCIMEVLRITFCIPRSFGINCPQNIVVIMAVCDYMTLLYVYIIIVWIQQAQHNINFVELWAWKDDNKNMCTSCDVSLHLKYIMKNLFTISGSVVLWYRFINFTFKIIKTLRSIHLIKSFISH